MYYFLMVTIDILWRRKWQPTPVFLPGESQGWGSLEGCHLWGHTESDKTEVKMKAKVELSRKRDSLCKGSEMGKVPWEQGWR